MVGTIAKPPSVAGYDHDFYAWTQQQAAALRATTRAGAKLAVDWENVAEEIESLGRSDARELRSGIATIVEHFLKLEFAPTDLPRAGWEETVDRSREAFEKLIAESPSLRPSVVAWVENEHRGAARRAPGAAGTWRARGVGSCAGGPDRGTAIQPRRGVGRMVAGPRSCGQGY